VTVVDRLGKPGGHWNHAYAFVTLHQPSAFYGVNSMELGSGLVDTAGMNEGLGELASGAEVTAYFDRVMQRRLLPSGRVRFLPLCNHLGDGRVESLLSGARTHVHGAAQGGRFDLPQPVGAGDAHAALSRRRRRDRRAAGRPSPASGTPPEAGIAAPLRRRRRRQDGDGHLHLAAAERRRRDAITWVVPRDSWLLNRATTQNAPQFFDATVGSQADMMKAVRRGDVGRRPVPAPRGVRRAAAHRPASDAGDVPPRDDHPARGRAAARHHRRRAPRPRQAIEADRMTLDRGEVDVAPGSIFVDCTASAVEPRPLQPIFQDGRIVLQLVRVPQPTFSAAIIAYVEAHGGDDARRNRLCAPAPFSAPALRLRALDARQHDERAHWQQDEAMRRWVRGSRLDAFSKLIASAPRDDVDKQALIGRFREQAGKAFGNLARLAAADPDAARALRRRRPRRRRLRLASRHGLADRRRVARARRGRRARRAQARRAARRSARARAARHRDGTARRASARPVLLKKAARGFGGHEVLARARCVVAEAEVALAMRDLGGSPRPLAAAAAALEARSDRYNALQARLIAVRRLLLLGRLADAARALAPLEMHVVPPSLAAVAELTAAELALRSLRVARARDALARAKAYADRAQVPALVAEVDDARPRSSDPPRGSSPRAARRRFASARWKRCSRPTRSCSTAAGAACAPAPRGSRWRAGRSCSPSPARSPRRGRATSTARP
jgi:hypothetical protein